MSDTVWSQASLPVCYGGLGIRRTEELALPAYLASVYFVLPLISGIHPALSQDDLTQDALLEWSNLLGTEFSFPENRSSQRRWDEPICEKRFSQLVADGGMECKARLLGVSSKESGAWLHALPSVIFGNLLDNDSLRIAVALRFGAAVCAPHICRCGSPVDCNGVHGLSCLYSAGTHSRHGAINEIVRRSLVSASVPAVLEPPGLDRGDGKRPDGLTLLPWKQGKALVWDVTCVDTLAISHLPGCSTQAGKAAEEAEALKRVKYRSLEDRYIFYPLGMETFGAWGPAAKELISAIGNRIKERTGEPRSSEFLRQRISIELQRGNAASVLGSLPSTRGLEEVFLFLALNSIVL